MQVRVTLGPWVGASVFCLLAACTSSGDAPGAAADAGIANDAAATIDAAEADATAEASPCLPVTCEAQGAQCGSIPDGCGGKLECGTCEAETQCGGGGANRCGTDPCTARTCMELGAACGYASDGCAEAIHCGTCPAPLSCGGAGTANQCGCVPRTCTQLQAECGMVPDGCIFVVDCGACPAGRLCGGDGPNRCGTNPCVPKTCTQLAASCGYVSDQCSMAVNCGQCPPGGVCGGGGVPNQCACTCSLPNATTLCNNGVCTIAACEPGYANCDGAEGNGCETKTSSDEDNCGSCGNACTADGGSPKCDKGTCTVGDCHGPEHCGGAESVCCAKLKFGDGTLPNCTIDSAVASCAASCAFSIPTNCPGDGQVTFCQVSADCANDAKAKKCCSFQTGTPQPFCVNDLLAGFATACF
jgi:hypothetical protein